MALSYPAAWLSGCHGLSGASGLASTPPTAETTPTFDATSASNQTFSCAGNCDPFAQLYSYPANGATPTISNLPVSLYSLITVPDRFAGDSLAYGFNGTNSLAAVEGIGNVASGSFAISFWGNTSNTSPEQAWAIANGTTAIAALEFNNKWGIGVHWGNYNSYVLAAGEPGQFADGNWHHFLVQFDGTNLSAYVDGALQSTVQTSGLNAASELFIGGSAGLGWHGAIDDLRLYNRVFNPAEVPSLVYAWTQVKAGTRNDSLIAYYPFNGNATNANGKGFDGTTYDVIPAVDRFGNAGRAYAFNGATSYISLPTALGPFTTFSLGFWVQSTQSVPMTACSVTRGAIPGDADLNFVFNSGHGLEVKVAGGTATSIAAGSSGWLTDGSWHFIFLQCLNGSYQLYVDGVLQGRMTNNSPVLTTDSIVRFGRASGTSLATANFWLGSIDDCQIYSTASSAPFTAAQIRALMQLQYLPRDGAGALVFQNQVWLLGGWNPGNALDTTNEVYVSSDGANWNFVNRAPWERRHMAGWLVYNGRMWVVGGDNNTGHYQNDVWSSADGINWVQETGSVPWANRATQITTVFNGQMWYMGGEQIDSPDNGEVGGAYHDVYSSRDGRTWTQVTPGAAWSPRGIIIGNVVYEGKMWIIGGGTYDDRTYLNDVWNSTDGATWNLVNQSAPWAGRQFHNIALFDNKMWVIAGSTALSEGGSTDVWYSTDGVNWTNLPGPPWTYRHAASVFTFQNALWLANGSSAAVYNDVWKLTYAE
jgi:hypothetical protein